MTILYVNGDSHSTAAEAVNKFCFAEDDIKLWNTKGKRLPHPDNLEVSYGNLLSKKLNTTLICEAEAASSNDRIIRTTTQYLENNKPDIIVIGWSTWEREEWYNDEDKIWYQVNCSGIDQVPKKWAQRYKDYILNINWQEKTNLAHEQIWNFHMLLKNKNIPHLFFNTFNYFFTNSNNKVRDQFNWELNYIQPYNKDMTFVEYLKNQHCKHNSVHHFGPDGHEKWAEFLLPHLTKLL